MLTKRRKENKMEKIKMIKKYSFWGSGANGISNLSVDAESTDEAIRLLGKEVEAGTGATGILKADDKQICTCYICNEKKGNKTE